MNNKKILIIEDEKDFAEILQLRLNMIGYEVEIALDAYEGNKQLVNKDFDLIITDLSLPVGDGFSLLEKIKKIPDKSHIPVVIVTGQVIDEELINKARKNKVSAVFPKPHDPRKFLSKIKSLVPV